MIRARVGVVLVAVAFATSAAATSGCDGGNDSAPQAGTSPSVTTAPVQQDSLPPGTQAPETTVPGAEARVVLRGTATLDGAPFDAEFLGAVISKDGLITPCQGTLPRVDAGGYEIPVMGAAEASGCGVAGAEILLWTFTNDTQYFSSGSTAWPGDGGSTTFDATFTTAAPDGAAPPRTEMAGEIFERDRGRLEAGTRVEAYIDNTLCGVASVRTNGDFTGFSLSVVGPESVAGCTRDATVTFRVDGRQAETTTVNNFGVVRSLDLTLP